MPLHNKVSAALTPEVVTEIKSKISAIGAQLPFLISLSTDERKVLPKMGDRSLGFVETALEVAQTTPDAIPGNIDVAEFARDVALYSQLKSLALAVAKLSRSLDDTTLEVGAEAYDTALAIYRLLKAVGDPAHKSAVEELARRFKQSSSGDSSGADEAAPGDAAPDEG